jgi:glycosyltransferase involved in cell wall biosynthesis
MQRRLAGSRMYPWNKTLGNWSTSHAEINRVLRGALGSVPTRWLSNYAHVVLIERGIGREQQLKFTASLVLLTWWASLRWNHRLSADVRHLTGVWLRDAYQNWRSRRAAPAAAPDAALPAVRSGHERRLRIALDVSQTGTLRAGCGQMALGLAQALEEFEQHDYLLYPTLGDAYWDPSGPDATWRSNRAHMRRWTAHPSLQAAREFWRKPPPNLDEALGSPDVLHSHNFFCPRGLAQARVVYTLHDLGFLQDPDWTTEANRQACFEGVFNASLYADFMIAMSEATRRHFQTMFPHYPEERTAVVYSASRFTGRGPVRRPRGYWKLRAGGFLLTVGTLEPRKNLTRLLTAYASYAARASTPLPLVLAGSDGWLMERLDEQIAALGLQRRVIRLGYVDDRALLWLYQNCCAFLYPSLFEGFGLPVVEALSQGAAVMTSNTTSLPEVAGDAALFVDPIDVAAMTAAVERLVVDAALRDDLKRRAVVQAARFSWQATAEQTLRCYQRAMRLPKYVAAMSSRAS